MLTPGGQVVVQTGLGQSFLKRVAPQVGLPVWHFLLYCGELLAALLNFGVGLCL